MAALLMAVAMGCGKTPAPPAPKSPHSGELQPAAVAPRSEPSRKDGSPQASPDRVAAEWVLGLGGETQVESVGKRTPAKSVTELPTGDFLLVSANLANNAKVTDDGLTALTGAKKLETLNLNGSAITTRGVAKLGQLTGLKYLNLCVPKVGDAEMAVLAALPDLYALEISYTQVGDAGLESLKKCKSLHTLYVSQTKVTERGVASLKAALPQLQVMR
jgi:hypothetical protein